MDGNWSNAKVIQPELQGRKRVSSKIKHNPDQTKYEKVLQNQNIKSLSTKDLKFKNDRGLRTAQDLSQTHNKHKNNEAI